MAAGEEGRPDDAQDGCGQPRQQDAGRRREVSLYLDASVLVALFVIDPLSARATAFLSAHPAIVVVSDFGAAEFSSAVARRVRTGDLTREDGQLAFLNFDTWIARSAHREEINAADIGAADRILRRLDVNLRTPDAV